MAWKTKTGDIVFVITGDYKGVKGKVLSVDRQKARVVVEGVNFRSRHMKPSVKYPEGGIIKKEHSIHISNVAIAEPDVQNSLEWSNKFVTRVGFRFNDNGEKIRYSKRSQKVIPQ